MGTQDKEWHEGFPEKPGWYWCRVDGEEEMWLKHFICTLSGRHEWAAKGGDYIYSIVEWSGMPH